MRKVIILLSCVTAVLLAGYGSYRGYKVWKERHFLAMARNFLAKSDGRNAALSLQQALAANPKDTEAYRLMAQLAEAGGSQSALLYRSRVVELNPKSAEDRLALAQTALIFREYAVATNALEGVSDEARKTAAYHNVSGAVAAATSRIAEAEAHFQEACRLEPTNQSSQLNLAIVRLAGTNALDVAEARITLQRIISHPNRPVLYCAALRGLIHDAMHSKQTETALALSQQLIQDTNSAFSDKLLRLDVLRELKSSELERCLTSFQREATNKMQVFELGTWKATKTSPAEALSWLVTIPAANSSTPPVAVLVSECRVAVSDWSNLYSALTNQNWADLEFLRHAFIMRSLREQGLSAAAKAEWDQVLKAANGQRPSLSMLFRTVAQWKWDSEAEEVLWAIVNRFPDETWAFQSLGGRLFVNGRTRPLLSLLNQELKRFPANLSLKNNLASVALLLDANELKPYELARDVYDRVPTNAAFASTYAYSLLLQQKPADALKVMRQLAPQQLDDPAIAGYYGLILKANGDATRGKTYLSWAFRAKHLPEEEKLFRRAEEGG